MLNNIFHIFIIYFVFIRLSCDQYMGHVINIVCYETRLKDGIHEEFWSFSSKKLLLSLLFYIILVLVERDYKQTMKVN